MKIVLQKNHHSGGKFHLAGETIDVPKEEYDHIMAAYMAERGQQVQVEAKAEETLRAAGLTEEQFEEAKAIGKKV